MKASLKYTLSRAAVLAALALGGSASAALADTPSWCGPKKATIALLDGFGGNSWRQVTTAAGKQEAEKCPSITKYLLPLQKNKKHPSLKQKCGNGCGKWKAFLQKQKASMDFVGHVTGVAQRCRCKFT